MNISMKGATRERVRGTSALQERGGDDRDETPEKHEIEKPSTSSAINRRRYAWQQPVGTSLRRKPNAMMRFAITAFIGVI